MPLVTLVPGNWTPDRGDIEHDGLWKVNDAIPFAGRWASLPTTVSQQLPTATYAEKFSGMHVHYDQTENGLSQPRADSWFLFFGDDGGNLWRSSAAQSANLTLAIAAPVAAPDTVAGWQFASFGNQVWATNYLAPIQFAATTTTNFSDGIEYSSPDSYRPQALFVSTIKNHLLLANIRHDATLGPFTDGDTSPSMVMWSATDNPRRFGDPANTPSATLLGSDYQDIADEFGEITGLVGGDYALIFKSNSIWRMDGPPFTFRPIATGWGTVFCNSIVRFGEDIYFMSASGPAVVRGGHSTPELIGKGTVANTVFGNHVDYRTNGDVNEYKFGPFNQSYAVWGAVDQTNGLIVWGLGLYSQLDHTRILIYNVYEDRFGFAGGTAESGLIIDDADERVIQMAKSTTSTKNEPLTLNSSPVYTSSLLGDLICYDNNTSGSNNGNIFVFSDTANGTIPAFLSADFAPKPSFTWPFLKFYPPNGTSTQSSRIIRVRPIYNCRTFTEAGDGVASPLSVAVTVDSQSRFPGSWESKTVTYDPYVDPYQDENGWIQINSTAATHHRISVQFIDPSGNAVDYPVTPLMRSMFELEVEYHVVANYATSYR